MDDIRDFKAVFTRLITDQATVPNISEDDLQAWFDENPGILKTALNNALDYIYANYFTKTEIGAIQAGTIASDSLDISKMTIPTKVDLRGGQVYFYKNLGGAL